MKPHEMSMNSTITVSCETTVSGSVVGRKQTILRLSEAPEVGDMLLNLPMLEAYRVVAVEDDEIFLDIGCGVDSISLEKALSFMWLVR